MLASRWLRAASLAFQVDDIAADSMLPGVMSITIPVWNLNLRASE